MIEALDKPGSYWITADLEYNRNCRSRRLSGQCRAVTTDGCNDAHVLLNQLGGKPRKCIALPFCPTILDCNVLALHKARLVKALTKRFGFARQRDRRSAVKISDHGHGALLPICS